MNAVQANCRSMLNIVRSNYKLRHGKKNEYQFDMISCIVV